MTIVASVESEYTNDICGTSWVTFILQLVAIITIGFVWHSHSFKEEREGSFG